MKRMSLDEAQTLIDSGKFPLNADAPAGPDLGDGFWDDAEIVLPEAKTPISLRVDAEVLDWFKAQGPGYQTRMNAVLKSYMTAQRRKAG